MRHIDVPPFSITYVIENEENKNRIFYFSCSDCARMELFRASIKTFCYSTFSHKLREPGFNCDHLTHRAEIRVDDFAVSMIISCCKHNCDYLYLSYTETDYPDESSGNYKTTAELIMPVYQTNSFRHETVPCDTVFLHRACSISVCRSV